jgi:hypothetical protein
MHMKVSREQFEMRGDQIVHVPTGATFWKGDEDIVRCDWGTAGQPLPSGHDYGREELKDAAHEIFLITRARPIG